MRKMIRFAAISMLMLAVMPLFAQLTVSIRFNRRTYMQYEQVYVCVTIRNDSGRPLLFGDRPELQGFILFDVRDKKNRLIPRHENSEIVVSGLYIAPGEIKNLVFPLSQYYDLTREGNYYIHAYVSHNNLPNEYRSKEESIRVSEGTAVWKKTVGLPSRIGSNNYEGERTYSISKVDADGSKLYYLKVEDSKNIYAVTRLGLVLAHMKFEAQVDMLSRIHLLMPVGPRIYHYMAFNAEGLTLEDSYWKTHGTVPMLHRDSKTGKVTRMGGVKARKGVDYADPRTGTVSLSDLTGGAQRMAPSPGVDSGVVDLGKGLMPVKSADED